MKVPKDGKQKREVCVTCWTSFYGPDAAELLRSHYELKHPTKPEKK